MIGFIFFKGTDGPNKYGPPPEYWYDGLNNCYEFNNFCAWGLKEDVVPELHAILEKAQKRGVDVKNMVVDFSFLTWVREYMWNYKYS